MYRRGISSTQKGMPPSRLDFIAVGYRYPVGNGQRKVDMLPAGHVPSRWVRGRLTMGPSWTATLSWERREPGESAVPRGPSNHDGMS